MKPKIGFSGLGELSLAVYQYLSFHKNKKVSRTFGDIESKLASLGGIDGVVVADPEISTFNIDQD